MGKVLAVCASKERGVAKKNIESMYFLENWGGKEDAHAGHWHRQVSLLGAEKIEEFCQKGVNVPYGTFGENLVVEGFDFRKLPVGTWLRCNEVLLEITQIGKECHTHCAIYQAAGDCIMPREGVFAKVLQSGTISVGDEMAIEKTEKRRPWQAAVITLSDKGARGEREDISGRAVADCLESEGYEVVEKLILPDERSLLQKTLVRLADQRQLDLILTTGGTGFGLRDVTPEATLAVATRNVPGIAEAMRAESMKFTKKAMLSRGASVIRNKTLIINMPGSPKACRECMNVFMEVLPHGLGLLRDEVRECGES
ncbi:MOSC domain-containing protein [[Clostridium] polysaccharolyticum]|uniref:Molybdenum cofactor synthesis domain-containing protein n=1 Tax=[Clostridium] polysaccharolyticum TaxID=29364 RepID=A0A1I0EEE4_9FIRM|nr:MOSC domain-containing protein [[Clostridium] polysaccharolyticum]SET43714.1 molybdenum cofactor synthesis domain-containing protein [[Clostridium] polysaccharolyticum]